MARRAAASSQPATTLRLLHSGPCRRLRGAARGQMADNLNSDIGQEHFHNNMTIMSTTSICALFPHYREKAISVFTIRVMIMTNTCEEIMHIEGILFIYFEFFICEAVYWHILELFLPSYKAVTSNTSATCCLQTASMAY